MSEPDRQWYVIRVDYRQEKVVENLLHDARIEGWLPMQKIEPKRRGGRKHQSDQPTFQIAWPGYMFVRVANRAHAWLGVAGVKHVRSVLGYNERPVPVSDDEIIRLRCLLEKDPDAGKAQALAFKLGQKVRIVDGPFASYSGTVDSVDEFRVWLEVAIFGRSTIVELDLAQVAKGR
ncbi:transcription termination/antitermination protein NusG [Tianweitania sediminis]|uniref:Transcriptional antiterminator NusG n=2 Tax=Tianweitania sediminis TaxID=1502156 RepID=A0A8J7RPF9_9HYPH|nr:transcription termination/antitermination protein NusG [Tianweitania sediminis]MBP0439599.1 transcriptional antiterminator NusG [Tianweitania sediminis]